MATLTKAQSRTMIRQLIDDPNAKLWTDANLDILTSLTLDDLWSDIFDFSPWFTSKLDTLTSITSPGFVDLRHTGDGGALSERFHRLQLVTRNSRHYYEHRQRNILIEANSVLTAPDDTYIFLGDQLWLFPLDTASDVEIRYSFKPAEFTTLTDGTKVTWPQGHESVYLYETAARALTKGDREENARVQAIADKSWQRMLSAVRRRGGAPIQPFTTDSPQSIGGI